MKLSRDFHVDKLLASFNIKDFLEKEFLLFELDLLFSQDLCLKLQMEKGRMGGTPLHGRYIIHLCYGQPCECESRNLSIILAMV